jgi:hypothetical protein
MAKTVVKTQTLRLASLLLKARTQFLCYLFSFLLVQFCFGQELPSYSLKDAPIVVNIDSVRNISDEVLKFSNIRFVPLETTDDCLVGVIDKVLIRDNRIYVADYSKAKALFVFDMEGKIIFKIADSGQGPGEYIGFKDFDVHDNGDIYIFDQFGKKFLVYNSDEKYLREIKTDYSFMNFCLVKDKMYWAPIFEKGKKFAALAVYDMANKKTEFLFKDKKSLVTNDTFRYVTYQFFSTPHGLTYYSPRFSEIIYAIDENGVRPAIGIKNLRIPPVDIIERWELKPSNMAMLADEFYFKENNHIYETDRYIAFKCIKGRDFDALIYDKPSGKLSAISTVFFHMFLCVDGIHGSTGEDFFSVMVPQPEYKEHRKLLESREDLKNWSDDDNPVIVFFNLDI